MFFEDMGIDAVDLDLLEELAANWLNKYRRILSPKTTQRRLTSMRCLGRSQGRDILREYAAPTAAAPTPHPLPRLEEDLDTLMAVTESQNDRILLTLLGRFGLRISEARAVQPVHFDISEMVLSVHGKGEKTRHLPVAERAWDTLCPVVVDRWTSGRANYPIIEISDRTARDRVTRLGVKAGISRSISSHDLRATFATVIYNKTKDIELVRGLLGHASVTQTQVYLGISMSAMREAVKFGVDDG